VSLRKVMFDSSVTLTSSANPVEPATSVTFTATVAGPVGEATPTGTVEFKDGGTTIGSGTLNGSGVATFSQIKPRRVDRGFDLKAFDNEGRVLATAYDDFVLFNIYFPNGKRGDERLKFKLDFYDAFLKVIDRYRKAGEDKIIICGDVNTAHKAIDLARPKENRNVSGFLPEECAWIDRLLDHGFIDTFREFQKEGGHYSYWDQISGARQRNVGWRIDYFFISENLKPRLKNAFILPEVMGSDHCPVGIELS